MQIDNTNKEINVQQETYLRINTTNEPLYTYIHKGREKLKARQVKEDFNKSSSFGLVANNVFNYIYTSTNASLLKSSTNERILFKSFDLDLLNYPDESTTIRTVNKDVREDVAKETFKEHYEQQINDIKTKNDIIERETAKSIHKKMARNRLYKVLSNIRAYKNKFLDVKDGTELNVYGFKETNTKYGKTYLLACSLNIVQDQNDKLIEYLLEQTILQLYWCPTNITHYIDAVLSNKEFKQLDINGITAYESLTGIPLTNKLVSW